MRVCENRPEEYDVLGEQDRTTGRTRTEETRIEHVCGGHRHAAQDTAHTHAQAPFAPRVGSRTGPPPRAERSLPRLSTTVRC